MNWLVTIVAGIAFAIPTNTFAGGWTGAGGNLIEDAHNPWFIRMIGKKAIIPYCIIVDQEHFPVPIDQLRAQIDNAFNHWADEFSSAEIPQGTKILVATENFVHTACTEDDYDKVPLRFQFGKLLAGQMEKFKALGRDPRRMVGIAIREDYDREHLRGRGFIYLPAETGPLAISGDNIVDRPWSGSYNRLQLVLRHEIGHIFGISHIGDNNHIMGEGFPEQVVNAANQEYQWVNPARIFLKSHGWSTKFHCYSDLGEEFTAFIGIPADWKCIEFRMQSDRILLKAAPNTDFPLQTIGNIEIHDRDKTLVSVAKFWVPPEQKVLPSTDDNGKSLTLAYATQFQISGVLHRNNSADEHLALFDIGSGWFRLGGELNGKLILSLFKR